MFTDYSSQNKIYIIVLNHKGWKDTIECLESVFKLKNVFFQVLLIDNSPTSESVEKIEHWANGQHHSEVKTDFPNLVYPKESKPISYIITSENEIANNSFNERLIVIKANENKGFSAGNNIGLRYALKQNDFQFCWLLNNDTVVEPNSLYNQLKFLKSKSSKIGILGSVLVNYYKKDKIQAIGGSFNKKTILTNHIGEDHLLSDLNEETEKIKIDYVVGASMLVSKDFLKDVGLLSEDFFLYYEELDWAHRAALKDWEIDWCPGSIVYHKEGKTIGSDKNYKKRSLIADIESFRSRKIFFDKYYKNKLQFSFYSFLIVLNRVRRFHFRVIPTFFKILMK